MTQTLTTEELRQIVENDHVQCGDAAAMARELLANREAQPVDNKVLLEHSGCGNGIQVDMLTVKLNRGDVVVQIPGNIKKDLSDKGEQRAIIYTAPPAPAVPPEKQHPDVDDFGGDPYYEPYITECDKVDGWNDCRAAMLAQPVSQGCEWTYDEHDSKWDSSCGDAWMFCDGGPTENGVKFCQSCGKPVLLAAAPEGSN